jgi:hypothetical protein
MVFSCVATKKTNVSDRVTHALFEYLEKNESEDGRLVLPGPLATFSHKDKVSNIFECSGSINIKAVG